MIEAITPALLAAVTAVGSTATGLLVYIIARTGHKYALMCYLFGAAAMAGLIFRTT